MTTKLFLVILVAECYGVPFCEERSGDPGYSPEVTLCDSRFCVCNDPYGRVRCRCESEVEVDELIVKSTGSCAVPPETTSLLVDNCDNVTVIRDAFAELKELQMVSISNVRKLSIEPNGFRWRGHGLHVNLTNVTVIPDIPSFAFAGRIRTVLLENSYVGMIRAFAFSKIESAEMIAFRGINAANVESQAFKKFPVGKFIISNSQFNSVPSRFVFELEVESLFKVEATFADSIRTQGFMLSSPKVSIVIDCRINAVQSEAFRVRTAGDVLIRDNRFGRIEKEAFRGFSVERYVLQHAGKPKFKFVNNTVAEFGEKSLYCNRSAFDAVFARVMVEEQCTCDGLSLWKEMIQAEDLEAFWCRGDADFVHGKEFHRSHCVTLTKSIFFFVIIIAATGISLALIIIFIACFVRHRRKWNPVPAEEQTRKPGAKAIIVPDGRTYRETEFHVIVEKAEPLEVGYVPCKVVRDRSRTQIPGK